MQGPSGLRLRFSPTYPASDPNADIGPYESDWASVMACVGVSAPAPFLVLVPFGSITRPDGTLAIGLYLSKPPLFLTYGRSDRRDFKHEAVHYLLEVSTGDADAAHRSPLFQQCAGI